MIHLKGFIYHNQIDMFTKPEVIGFGSQSFYVQEIDRSKANDIIISNHYSHKFYSASYLHFGVFINQELLGVLQYGYAMNPASAGSVVRDTGMRQYLELNRMWLSEKALRNSESMAISYSIKTIKGKLPNIKWIQSFADERCNRYGVVYQAANFKYFGEHTAIFWYLDDEIFHNSLMTRNPKLSKSAAYLQANKERATSTKLRQFRYIYFIDKRSTNDCLLSEQAYPKNNNTPYPLPQEVLQL